MKKILITILILLMGIFLGCNTNNENKENNESKHVHIYALNKCFKYKEKRSWGNGCYEFVLDDNTKIVMHLHQCLIIKEGECPFCKGDK